MTTNEELRRAADQVEMRRRADMVEKEHWEGLVDALRHAPPELRAYLEWVEPAQITALLDELEALRADYIPSDLQQSMLQDEWQRGYDEGLNDGINK